MTYDGESPFGSSPSGRGDDGPFGPSSLSHGDRATHQPNPSAGSPFAGGASPTPPPVNLNRQSTGVTVAWIAAGLALVVGLGGGGAAVVNALTDSSRDSDVSDALVIDEGAGDVAHDLTPGSGTEVEDHAELAAIYRNSSDCQSLVGEVGALRPGFVFATASGATCSSG